MGTGRREIDPRPKLRALERRRAILAGMALILFGVPFLGAFLSPRVGAFGLVAWVGAIGIAILAGTSPPIEVLSWVALHLADLGAIVSFKRRSMTAMIDGTRIDICLVSQFHTTISVELDPTATDVSSCVLDLMDPHAIAGVEDEVSFFVGSSLVHVAGSSGDTISISKRRAVLTHLGQNSRTIAIGAIVLASVAKGLLTKESDTARLFHRFATADDPGLRRWCFERLIGPHGPPNERAQAIMLGLYDAEPRIRLIAGRCAGDRGIDVLRALAVDPSSQVQDEIRRAALDHLLRSLNPDASAKLLVKLIECPAFADAIREHAACSLLVLRTASEAALLCRLANSATGAALGIVATGLGRYSGEKVEQALISLLDRRDDVTLRSAIESLAEMGSAAVIAHLSRPFFDPDLERCARRAAQKIRARLEELGAVRGGLSIAQEGDSGALSTIGDSRGELTILE